MAKSTEQRFWSHVQGGSYTECWIWTASLKQDQGYGQFTVVWGLTVAAHLWSYQFMVGPIPDGLQVDHLCHTRDLSCPGGNACLHRRCVNPWHLEPVTPLVNTRRSTGHASQTHCMRGHRFDEENTYYERERLHRICRACRRENDRKRNPERYQRKKSALASAPVPEPSPYRGVTWDRGAQAWTVRIRVAGKRKYIGSFHNQEDAARAYDAAAMAARGEQPNFPVVAA